MTDAKERIDKRDAVRTACLAFIISVCLMVVVFGIFIAVAIAVSCALAIGAGVIAMNFFGSTGRAPDSTDYALLFFWPLVVFYTSIALFCYFFGRYCVRLIWRFA